MRAPLVTLVDDALPAPLFRALLGRVEALGGERLRTTYQSTTWYPLAEEPSNVVEEAVQVLAKAIPAATRRRAKGVEWWLSRMRTSNVQVDFHRDRDNARSAKEGREVNPLLSSVLYLNRCVGGLLAVTREPPNPLNPALAPSRHDFDFVEPVPNRFVHFPSKLTHGVLDSTNSIPGPRRRREPALRLSIAINWWRARPLEVPTFAEAGWYSGLAGRSSRPFVEAQALRPPRATRSSVSVSNSSGRKLGIVEWND